MKRFTFAMSVILFAMFISSCSTTVDFVVINRSDHTIEVEYKGDFDKPTTMSFSDWDAWFGDKNEKWKDFSNTEYRMDEENETIKVKLAPNQVLRFLNSNDSIYFNDEGKNKLSIKYIRLSGKNGVLIFENGRVFKQFREKNFTKRFIEYR